MIARRWVDFYDDELLIAGWLVTVVAGWLVDDLRLFLVERRDGLALRAVTAELVEQTKMGDAGAPGAFTDLIHWRGQWWCTFREGEAHGGGDGRI